MALNLPFFKKQITSEKKRQKRSCALEFGAIYEDSNILPSHYYDIYSEEEIRFLEKEEIKNLREKIKDL